MKRKLIKQGINGLTVYLPQKWTKERHLKGGEEIEIEQFEDKLIISTEKNKDKKDIEIQIGQESKEFIRNYLNQLYKLGYDKIKINCQDKEKLLLCQKFVSMFLLGFEITKAAKDFCIAENISEPSEEKQESVIRRIFFIIEGSFELLEKDISEGRLVNEKEINRNTKKVTQYDNFCKRWLVRQNLAFGTQFFKWEIYANLLQMQHSFFHIYDKCKNKRLDKKLFHQYLKSSREYFSEIHKAFYSRDIKSLDNMQKSANNLLSKLLKERKSYADANKVLFHYLCELIRLEYLLVSPMISVLQSENSSMS